MCENVKQDNHRNEIDDYQKELNEKYKDIVYPQFMSDEKCYVVNTFFGVELGDATWITDCFIFDSPYYRFRNKKWMGDCTDHAHGFKGVLDALFFDPISFDITGLEEDYSSQEIIFISRLRQLILEFYPKYHYAIQDERDKQLKVASEFNDILEAIIENPESFNIKGYKSDYSLQQRAVINNLRNSIIVAKKYKKIPTKKELIEKREHFHLFEAIRKEKQN